MRLWRVLLVTVVAAVVSSGSAWTQEKKAEKPGKTVEDQFQALDKDGDGILTLEEFMAPVAKKPQFKLSREARFKSFDKDGDSKVTLEEFKKGMAKFVKKKSQ